MQLGTSFSHRHLSFLGHNPQKALKALNQLNLKWIRLATYWDEIEPQRGKYNFKNLDPLIKQAKKNGLSIVLTVGIKAPRWPEYYLPPWLKEKPLADSFPWAKAMISQVIKRYKKEIDIWQVENEPLDPAGPNKWKIPILFLEQEVKIIKNLSREKPVLVTLWANQLSLRKVYKKIPEQVDIIGLDLYLKTPIPLVSETTGKYLGPLDPINKIARISKRLRQSKQLWVTELQAEPWEAGEIVTRKDNPRSFQPKDFKKNLDYIKEIKPMVTLLWGFEWWYHSRQKGNNLYWERARQLLCQNH